MSERPLSAQHLRKEFFKLHPDYQLCRTLADNIIEGVTTRGEALRQLAARARAVEQNREEIQLKLDQYSIREDGATLRVKSLTLRNIMALSDDALGQVIRFYLKHPYAHGRTRKSRLWPRWMRTFFLSVVVGHAKRRGLELDYPSCFEMLRFL